jgi:hypothetical protein
MSGGSPHESERGSCLMNVSRCATMNAHKNAGLSVDVTR